MKKQKLTSLLVAVGMVVSLVIPMSASAANAQSATDAKTYSSATLSDNFVPGKIEVVLEPSASKINKIWAKSDFSKAQIVSIDDLTKFTGNAASKTLLNTNNFHQILDITLKDDTKQGVLNAIQALQSNPNIEYVGPDYVTSVTATPNDIYYSVGYQWGLTTINAPAAWDITTGSASVTVGVLDSGIDTTNPDLADRVNTALSQNFTDDTAGCTAPGGPGTHVAGIIGAEGNNGTGVAGVNWDVTLVSLRVFESDGNGDATGQLSWVTAAVNYAIQNNIPILNFSGSWTGASDASFLAALNNYKGIFICAAGNDSVDMDATSADSNDYPAYYSSQCANVISVGASDSSDNVASFSNYGQTSVDLFAPGDTICSTYPVALGSYAYMSGTSMASPMVAGVAALMESVNPNLTAAQIKTDILNSVDTAPAFSGKCVTGGRLDAYKAVLAAR